MISIVVPIYNVEQYLEKCLDSIKTQTFTDYEVLMVNDGSTDNSAVIAQQYTSDPRFKLINKPNRGQGKARNIGIDSANGEYLCFIDSDDFIEERYLEVLYSLIMREDADIAQCGVNRVWTDGRKQPYAYTGLADGVYFDIGKYLLESSFVMCNKLYRRKLFDNLRYPEGIKFEDFALAPQIYSRAKKIVATGSTLYNYLWRNDSTTTKNKIQPDILKAQKLLEASELAGQYPEILQQYFVRQVLCSLVWEMMADKKYKQQITEILTEGSARYPHLKDNISDPKMPQIKILWARLLVKGHYTAARILALSYMKAYQYLRKLIRR